MQIVCYRLIRVKVILWYQHERAILTVWHSTQEKKIKLLDEGKSYEIYKTFLTYFVRTFSQPKNIVINNDRVCSFS